MRIFGRNDAFLLGGFAIAVWVISSRQLGMLLDRAREIDHSRGLQLVPALAILAVVFLVHQVRKREEISRKASVATLRACGDGSARSVWKSAGAIARQQLDSCRDG
jgi:hypothetical protein